MRSILVIFAFLVFGVSHAKVYKYKEANIKVKFDKQWVEDNNPRFDIVFTQQANASFFGLKRAPAHLFSSYEEIPHTVELYKKYLKDNLLKSQLSQVSLLINDNAQFEPFEVNQFKGFLYKSYYSEKQTTMSFYNWLMWSGKGVYNVVYVTANPLQQAEELFLSLVKEIQLIDKNINPFEIESDFEIADGSNYIDSIFGYSIPNFKNWMSVQPADLGLEPNENMSSRILVNVENGDAIFISPNCLDLNESEQQFILKNFSTSFAETSGVLQLETFEKQKYHTVSSDFIDENLQKFYFKGISIKLENCTINVLSVASNKSDAQKVIAQMPIFIQSVNNPTASQNKYKDNDQRIAFSNYYSALGLLAENDGLDGYKFYNKGFEIDNNKNSATYLINYYNTKKQYKKGLEVIHQLSLEILEDIDIKAWKAWLLASTEDYEQAISLYQQIFQQQFTNDEDFATYLSLLENNQSWKEAIDLINLHQNNYSKELTFAIKKATYLGFLEQKVESQQIIQALLENKSLNMDNVFEIMDVYYINSDFDLMKKLALNYLDNNQQNGRLWYYLGDAQYNLNEVSQALISMQKAQEIFPENLVIQEYIEAINSRVGGGNYALNAKSISPVETPELLNEIVSNLSPKFTDEDSETIYSTKGISFSKGKPITTTYSNRIKIYTKAAVERNKTLTFEYDEKYENVYINSVKVFSPIGDLIHELDASTVYITTGDDSIKADSDKTLNIPVPGIESGVEIQWVISTQSKSEIEEYPFERNFFISYDSMQMKSIFLKGDVDLVKSIKKGTVNEKKSKGVKIWINNNPQKYAYESFLPNLYEMSDWLLLSHKEKDWKKVADDYLIQIDDKLNSELSKGQLLSIFDSGDEPLEQVIRAANYIQKTITYQALEFGSRALIPNPSIQTLKNKYGDCKDHAVLLHDLLKHEGIDSQIALVHHDYDVVSELASIDQFNHAIVYVPKVAGGIFIDTTDKEIKIGERFPPRSLQGKQALILDKNKSYLKQIPLIQQAENQILIDRTIDKSSNYYLIKETIELSGFLASELRYSIKQNSSSDLTQSFQEWVSSKYSDLQLVSFNHYNLEQNQKSLILELEMKVLDHDDKPILPVFFEKAYIELIHANERKYDFQIKEPFILKSETKFLNNFIPSLTKDDVSGTNKMINWKLANKSGVISFEVQVNRYQGKSSEYFKFVEEGKKAIRSLEKFL